MKLQLWTILKDYCDELLWMGLNWLFYLLVTITLLQTNVSAVYIDPPHQEVFINNSANFNSIRTAYGAVIRNQDPTVDSPIIYATVKLFGLYPQVDDHILSQSDKTIFWDYKVKYAQSITGRNSMSDSSCADGQSTLNYLNYTFKPSINVTYNNQTTVIYPQGVVSPFDYSADYLAGDGNQTLNLSINGEFHFYYDRLDTYQRYVCLGYDSEGICSTKGCFPTTQSRTYEVLQKVSDSKSYIVENPEYIQFLSKPVLSEQWYKNNLFNNVLFSQRKFYKAQIKLNMENITNISFYSFSINPQSFGMLIVNSSYNYSAQNGNGTYYNSSFVPYYLEKQNNSFTYIYLLNSSYIGQGSNELTLSLFDTFGNSFSLSRNILSRRVAYGNITQGEGEINRETVRSTIEIKDEKINVYLVSLTIFVLLIVLHVRKIKN